MNTLTLVLLLTSCPQSTWTFDDKSLNCSEECTKRPESWLCRLCGLQTHAGVVDNETRTLIETMQERISRASVLIETAALASDSVAAFSGSSPCVFLQCANHRAWGKYQDELDKGQLRTRIREFVDQSSRLCTPEIATNIDAERAFNLFMARLDFVARARPTKTSIQLAELQQRSYCSNSAVTITNRSNAPRAQEMLRKLCALRNSLCLERLTGCEAAPEVERCDALSAHPCEVDTAYWEKSARELEDAMFDYYEVGKNNSSITIQLRDEERALNGGIATATQQLRDYSKLDLDADLASLQTSRTFAERILRVRPNGHLNSRELLDLSKTAFPRDALDGGLSDSFILLTNCIETYIVESFHDPKRRYECATLNADTLKAGPAP